MHLLAAVVVKKTIWHTLRRLGGPGLIVLGLVDNSAIPLPGSMDALTIVLSAAHKEPWWYYAIMATIGSLIGGYLTYRLGAEGGKETLEKKVSKKRAAKVYSIFERYGFWTVALGAICSPSGSLRPLSHCRWRHALSAQKFSGCPHTGTRGPLFIAGLSGIGLWTSNSALAWALLRAVAVCLDRTGSAWWAGGTVFLVALPEETTQSQSWGPYARCGMTVGPQRLARYVFGPIPVDDSAASQMAHTAMVCGAPSGRTVVSQYLCDLPIRSWAHSHDSARSKDSGTP